jgi:uncharacterized membrane protein
VRGWIGWAALTLALAGAVHVGTVVAVPRLLMALVQHGTAGGINRIHHGGRVTAASREVVRPSPDLLYSLCPYDLSTGPLRVTAVVPPTYFSISAFAANTDNFFVINDAQLRKTGAGRIELVLTDGSSAYTPRGAERVVRSPTTEGVVLFRTLIRRGDQLEQLVRVQRQARCRTVAGR